MPLHILYTLISLPGNDSLRSGLTFCWHFFHREVFELRRPIAAKFCTMLGSVFNFIILVQNFKGASPQKILKPKTCKIWPDFNQLQTLMANISRTNEDIQNRSSTRSTAIPPAFGKKVR